MTRELLEAYFHEGEGITTGVLANLLNRALSDLERLWPAELNKSDIAELGRRLTEGKVDSYREIVDVVIPRLEDAIDDFFASQPTGDISFAILDLLHPRVTAASFSHYRSGRFRDAVLNSIVAVFDLIRERTGIDKDGAELVAEAFSVQRPRLVFSTLDTESGRNEQKGFIQVLQGVYSGVRNPKAHSLAVETDQFSAAQYLVLASLLCRKVEECALPQPKG
jgi:uncharacterized protein (TIGR02391 family)